MLYALDKAWWEQYRVEARRTFSGALVSPQRIPGVHREMAWLNHKATNSGAAALAQAAWWCVERVVLLGYDCQHTGGQRHWHGDHPRHLGNAAGIDKWPAQFEAVLPRLAGMEVINATRETALPYFPRMTLEEALA